MKPKGGRKNFERRKKISKKPVIAYFPGAWDFLHAGHVLALEEAKEHCDYLIVGLAEYPEIGNPSKNTPIMSLEERYRMLRANKFVDAIVVYKTEYESRAIDKWFPYDVRFMGEDHKHKDYKINAPIYYTSRKHNYSSSDIRKRTYEAEKKKNTRDGGDGIYRKQLPSVPAKF